MLSDCQTRYSRNGDGSNKFGSMDADAAGDGDTNDDGSNEFNSDVDVNNNTGANVDADDDEGDTRGSANPP